MARGAWLTLLGVCARLALIANSPLGASQPTHHVEQPEESKPKEFHSNSIGVSRAIDLNSRTIAYKDHVIKQCYIEKISTQSAWDKDRLLIVHPMFLTTQQVETIGGHIISNFCYGWPSKLLRLPTNTEVRRKRSNQQYYFVGRKARGQTQSQYLQFGGAEDSPGKAEAEATRQGSKATVYGSRGMGQAQSQSDPFSCADCFGAGSQSPASLYGTNGATGGTVTGGRHYDASGQPIHGSGHAPGLLQTGDYGRGIPGGLQGGVGGPGRGDGRVTDGRGPGTFGATQTGQGFIPGRGSDQQHVQHGQQGQQGQQGLTPGAGQQLYTPDGRVISSPGQSLGTGGQQHLGAPGTGTGGHLPGGIPGRPGTGHQTHPAQIGTGAPGSIQGTTLGGPGTGTYFTPGSLSQQTGRYPGPGQTQPGQTDAFLPGSTVGGTGQGPSSLHIHPGQPGGSTVGAPGSTTYFGPGGQAPSSHLQPGQPGGLQHGTIGTPSGTGQAPGSFQIHPGQVGSTGGIGGQLTGGTGAQLYDNGGLQRPGGRPTHPGDVGLVSPGGTATQSGQPGQQGQSGQPGQTTYYIPGGIRPRPGDGSFGYYPTTATSPGRTQSTLGADVGGRDGTFNGQVAGQYRPAGGPGGEFSGTFQGRYSPHGSGTGGEYQGGQGTGTQVLHGTGGAGGQLPGQTQQGYPGYPDRSGGQTGQVVTGGQGGQGQWVQQPGTGGTGTYVPGQGQIPSAGLVPTPGQTIYPGQVIQPGGHPGQVVAGTGTGTGQYPSRGGQPDYQQGGGPLSGQGHVSGGQYPVGGGGQPGYQPGTTLTPGHIQTGEGGQYPGTSGGPGVQGPGQIVQRPGQGSISGGQYPGEGSGRPGYQQGAGLPGQGQIAGGQYPGEGSGQPGYQQEGGIPGQLLQRPGQQPISGSQYPGEGSGQPGYQQGGGQVVQSPGQGPLSGGQYPIGGTDQPGYQPGHTQTGGQYPGTGAGSDPGYQQGGGISPGQQQTPSGGQYPIGGSGQPGYQQGTGPGQLLGTSGGQYPGQPGYQTGPGQPGYGQQSGIPGGQGGQGGQTGQAGIYSPQQTGAGQGPFGQQSGQLGGGGVYQGGVPGSGSQGGQYQAPGALQTGPGYQGGADDDSDSQAQSTIQRADNETQASASSTGRFAGGNAQSQVSGSYAGTGSFSASAGSNDGLRGAQTQVTGNSEGTLSSSQGQGGRAKSQAQVQLSADTGDTISSAQTGGLNHGTNTQVQSGIKGGMADSQANGPGATSSQAQIGFTPYDATTNEDDPSNPHNGGGTASASSGTHAGKSQVQINGKYAFGIRYTGQAQASSANSGYTADNINLPTMKPIDFSQNTYSGNKPARTQQEQVKVRQIDDQTILQIVPSSTTPLPDEEHDDSDYDEYEDPNPPPPPSRHNLLQQAKVRSLMHDAHDALDPLEDLDDHGVQLQSDLKHGDIIPSGKLIPGSPGYKIPQGFRGRIADENTPPSPPNFNYENPRLVYAVGANANRRAYNDGFGSGSGYSYQPRYDPIQYGFKSTPHQPKNFVSVTKSETGSRNIITGKKTPSVYYTQSSTCGYFTNTCVYSNGRKICLPKPKANPDGTPIVCRN